MRLGRGLIVLAALGAAVLGSRAAAAALAVTRFGGLPYIDMVEGCARLGLRFQFSGHGRSMTIGNAEHRGVLLPPGFINPRETRIDGVRVFLGDNVVERAGRIYVSRTDYLERLLPIFRPDLIAPRLAPPRTIVLDPGHGGVDPGAENPRFHLEEKQLTLDVALRVRRLLIARGWKVVMIRTKDTQLSVDKLQDLAMRALVANQAHADLYVSIHFDAGNQTLRGSEILTFAPVGQRSTDGWGRRIDDRLTEVSPQDRSVGWSNVLAHDIFRNLVGALRAPDLGERIMHLGVLRPLNCPGALVEPVFISNEAEAIRVSQPAFREAIAQALAAGIDGYAVEVRRLSAMPRR